MKKSKVEAEIGRVRQLTTDLNGVMRSLHLPEAIEAAAGGGVPPSIIQKAAEIRTKGTFWVKTHSETHFRRPGAY